MRRPSLFRIWLTVLEGIIILLCGVLPSKAQSAPVVTDHFPINNIIYLIFNDGTASVGQLEDNFNPTILEIPEQITYKGVVYPVKRIANNAFKECYTLKTIHLPSTITEIGSEAFFGCTSLQNIELPKGLKTIDYSAFAYCSNLTSVSLPDSIITIEINAFAYCLKLTSIRIPSLITELASGIFFNCSSLVSVSLPNTLTALSGYNFESCSQLTTINTYSPEKDNDNLLTHESIILPDSLTYIGPSTFGSCNKIAGNLKIPSSVTKIGFDAFRNCSSISSIELPSGITSIDENTFSGCSNLISINIPPTVTTIGREAFYFCDRLRSISFPASLTSIYTNSIGTTGLTSVCFFGKTPPVVIGDNHLYWLNWDTSFYVPEESIALYRSWFHEYYSDNVKPLVKPIEGAKTVEIVPATIPIVKGIDTTLNIKAIVTTDSGNEYDGTFSWNVATRNYSNIEYNDSNPSNILYTTNSYDIIIVTVFTSDGHPITATCTIESMKIDCPIDKITMIPGDKYKIEPTILPNNYENDIKIRFTSDHPEIAQVNENTGEITAISGGQTTVLVEAYDEAGNIVATNKCKVYVSTGITPIYASMTIQINQPVPLIAQLKPEDDYWPVNAVNIVSHDESVARLNYYGSLQGFKVGETTIDCSYSTTTNYEYKFSYKVKVVDEINDFIIFADNNVKTMPIGSTLHLNATLENGDPIPVVWFSGDSQIADIGYYSGLVNAKKTGKCKFTALPVSYYLPEQYYEITITEKGIVSNISLNKTAIKLTIGEKEQLTAIIDSDDLKANIMWTSTDETVATVDATGEVTAIGEGLCEIVATIDGTDISAKCTVEVKESSGIIDADGNSINVETIGNQIIITGVPDSLPVTVFTTTGTCISSTRGDSTVSVATGIYIVQIGNRTVKVAVR